MKYLMSRLILVTVVFGWLQQNLFAVTCDNWTYVETTTSEPDKKGQTSGSGYVTDQNEIWKFVATRALGTSNLSLSGVVGATFNDPGEKTALNFTKITDEDNNVYAAVALNDLLSHYGSSKPYPDDIIMDNCDKVTEIIAPNCTSITGEGSFYLCTSLTNAVFAEGLTISNGRTFQGCAALVNFFPREFKGLNLSVFQSCSSLKGSFVLSESKSLSNNTFDGCSSLEEVIAPQATTIGEYVFSGCSSITNIVLGSPVTSINRGAFQKCPKIKTEFVQSLLTSSLTALWKYESSLHKGLVFNGCSGLEGDLVWDLKNLTTNVVPQQIFMDCNNLSSITFKTPILKFYTSAFYSASPSRLHVYMHAEPPFSYESCAVMSAQAPYPKVYLKDNFDEWLAVMKESGNDLIRKEAFNDSSKYSGKKDWATITGCMAKDAAMCTKVNGVVDVKDKYVIGFIMYDNAKGGCWILKKPKDGLRVIVR